MQSDRLDTTDSPISVTRGDETTPSQLAKRGVILRALNKRPSSNRLVFGSWVVLATVLVLSACSSTTSTSTANATGTAYPPVDGISCDQGEHSDYHIHVHVTMYINDQSVTIPAGVGIAPDGSCIYWLHTHDDSGIVHVEAPSSLTVTLNNFFDIWGQQFRTLQFPQEITQGGWSGYVNGQPISNITSITFSAHDAITLESNSSQAPDASYDWPSGY